jgi:ketosteroid isomerase-like protein
MASANVELVRSIFAAWERADFSSAEWAHPEIEFVIADGPEPVSLNGVAAMQGWFDDFLSAWDGYRLRADDYRELDDERVLALVIASGGRARLSGLELGQQGGGGASLFQVRAGKITRVVTYFNRKHGLAEFGLGPELD